jgi:Holliday junction resolvase
MTTPEKKVKDKVKRVLAEHGAYHFMPATHGYGSSGVPDIVACLRGKFVGIECKANGGKPTALQLKNLRELSSAGGLAILVDERGINDLNDLLTAVNKTQEGTFINFLEVANARRDG